MVLIDSSAWIDWFRRKAPDVDAILRDQQALLHSFTLGELALGGHASVPELVTLLAKLPHALSAKPSEVLHLIRRERLAGTGIGYVDASLLASAVLNRTTLLTRDKRLAAQAARMRVAHLEAPEPQPPPTN